MEAPQNIETMVIQISSRRSGVVTPSAHTKHAMARGGYNV